jgi:hypothetical protein
VAIDGIFHGVPHTANKILIYNPPTKLVSGSAVTDGVYNGTGKWSGGVTVNGILYCIPFNANLILIFNPATGVVSGSALTEGVATGS